MTSVYYLCDQDPQLAKQVTMDFTIVDNPHTTLANIRQRLDMMCGGHMVITPREGGGTKVLVTIPNR